MKKPVSLRIATRTGVSVAGHAKRLGQRCSVSNQPTGYQIQDGYLLKAQRNLKGYTVAVIDVPGYVYFAGVFRGGTGFLTLGSAYSVGTRDDFVPPGTETTIPVLQQEGCTLLPLPRGEDTFRTVIFATVQQSDGLTASGLLGLPLISQPPPDPDYFFLDDTQYFTYAQKAYVGVLVTSRLMGAGSIDAAGNVQVATPNPVNVQFLVTEDDLPSSWKLYPRRFVPIAQSVYPDLLSPGTTLPGVAVAPALPVTAAVGIDRYCVAARTFRQVQGTWDWFGDGRLGYDRIGVQGLLIAVGTRNREDVQDPDAQGVAQIDTLVVVDPNVSSIPGYLRPTPPFDTWVRSHLGIPPHVPDPPNPGTFLTPQPVRAGDGFVVYSVYTTIIDKSFGAQGSDDWANSASWYAPAWSVVMTTTAGQTFSVRADWDASGDWGGRWVPEQIPTGVDGEIMQPWIVGTAAVPGATVEDGYVGCAVVWEPIRVPGHTTVTTKQWSLYTSNGGAPVRTVLAGGSGVEPLFASTMPGSWLGHQFNYLSAHYDMETAISSVYYAGDNKLVTAAVSSGVRVVFAAVIDVTTGTIALVGSIANAPAQEWKCHITVIQNFVAATEGVEAKPAVLLASFVLNVPRNDGTGATYLSIDGGVTWREYIPDAGGQGGAFYIGNQLWTFDQAQSLDGSGPRINPVP